MSRLYDLEYLKHIEEALKNVLHFSTGKSIEDILNNEMLSYAIIRGFEIMGEASGKISKEAREKYPQLPWKDMINMRNRLIHNYFDIDHEIIWQTIKQELPGLMSTLKTVIKLEEKLH